MKHLVLFFLFVLSFNNIRSQENLILKYNTPAKAWEEALPLGNGYLGVMDYGNPKEEVFKLNEKTLWSGYPNDGLNRRSVNSIPVIQEQVNKGDFKEAGDTWINNCQGPYTARYLPMCDVLIKMHGNVKLRNRSLDISRAISSVDFEINGCECKRSTFVSFPDKVMIIKYESKNKSIFNFDLSLSSLLRNEVESLSNNTMIMNGTAPSFVPYQTKDSLKIHYDTEYGRGVDFQIAVKILASDVRYENNVLKVRNSDEVIIIVSGITNYKSFDRLPDYDKQHLYKRNLFCLKAAEIKGYSSLLDTHLRDYTELYNRCEIGIGNAQAVDGFTVDLLKNKKKNSYAFYNLLYQYGRYLIISSSREGTLPANLQGIWNDKLIPRWGCNYTIDINLQMCYWLTELTGISECHKPLLDFIESLALSGRRTAEVNYGISKGWMVHSNSDAWAQTVPQGDFDNDFEIRAARWTCWQMGGVWLAQHLWEHYDFNRDTVYLRKFAYPLIKSAVEFILNWIYFDENEKCYLTPFSTSPENKFYYKDRVNVKKVGELCKASTMDFSLIWDLFTNCIKATEILNIDNEYADLLKEIRSQLLPLSVGKYDQLQEWEKDYEDVDFKHRHLSHLFGLYPGKQFIPRQDRKLATVISNTLKRRTDEGPGWGMAWKVALWSRLENGNKALDILDSGTHYTSPYLKVDFNYGGLYPNLFAAYPPFQMDANCGIVAGMSQMFLQSHNDELFVLPALPDEWEKGYIKGLKARGNISVDIFWDKSELQKLYITSNSANECFITTYRKLKSDDLKLEEVKNIDDGNIMYRNGFEKVKEMDFKPIYRYKIKLEKGKKYLLKCIF